MSVTPRSIGFPLQCVGESRHHEFTSKVNYVGVFSGDRCDIVIGANRDILVVLNRDSLGPGLGLVDGVDSTVDVDRQLGESLG